MPEVIFYKDEKGNEPVYEFLSELERKSDKNSRIHFNKINDDIQVLRKYGTDGARITKSMKHLDGDIWELRPVDNRILFAAWIEDVFILLHVFIKKTQKTPRKEIEKAKKELNDFRERFDRDAQ
ncbi:MAG: type II toxin-antitoxin system RelE/ParE family toxin [Pyramidobacter sp.]|nr:type II toxin-antitoxin system RelE/ParE family toxin [Pyramidobacter sp.]